MMKIMPCFPTLVAGSIALLIQLCVRPSWGFVCTDHTSHQRQPFRSFTPLHQPSAAPTSGDIISKPLVVDRLLHEIHQEEITQNVTLIKSLISELEESFSATTTSATTKGTSNNMAADDAKASVTESKATEDLNPFLLGLYNVSYTQTAKMGDNPVGGKWTRRSGVAQAILKTRRTLQHLIPPLPNPNPSSSSKHPLAVAQAINVISLDGFGGLLRINVLLRGNAIRLNETECGPVSPSSASTSTDIKRPLVLSKRAVRALFDPPRIVFGKRLSLSIGPSTSVVLDTSYVDERIRIGVGGTSGTRFVFTRCTPNDMEAEEFRDLLAIRPVARKKALMVTLALAAAGFYGAVTNSVAMVDRSKLVRYTSRILAGSLSFVSILATALLASSGGIEDDQREERADPESSRR